MANSSKYNEEKENAVFAVRLRALFDEKKATHNELASFIKEKTGDSITRQAVGQWCNGNSSPNLKTVPVIAEFFGVSSDYLLGMSEVRSTDVDIKAVCEYTHLTDTAIDALEYIFEYGPQALTTLIYLLEQHFEVHADKYHFNLYEDQTSILAALSAYLRIEPKAETTTSNNELYISETGRLLTTQVKKDEKRKFEDGWRVQSVSNQEIIDKILFDSLEKAIRISKKEYSRKIKPYNVDFHSVKRDISADDINSDDECPF